MPVATGGGLALGKRRQESLGTLILHIPLHHIQAWHPVLAEEGWQESFARSQAALQAWRRI